MKTFPMFLKMEGRRVLVLGGGEQAAQKARLLLKTEAEVCVIAPELEPELRALASEGRIHWRNEPVTVELLRTAALVFSATGCAAAGAAHAALAREAHVLINVVDMPEYCEAMTPSIVDRDPLVVAIGTEGNAPVLGRQIKSRIEVMLEPDLGSFVRTCGRLRDAVARSIAPRDRRGFWDWVFNGSPRAAFAAGSERKAVEQVKAAIASPAERRRADCALEFVEAVEPDADLVTLRTLRLLQEADVIFYEQGLHDRILELARRDARRQAYVYRTAYSNRLLRLFSGPAAQQEKTVVLSGGRLSGRGWEPAGSAPAAHAASA